MFILRFKVDGLNRFLIKLGAFVLIQVVLLMLIASYGSRDANCNEYMYAFKDKIDLLAEAPSPRIIFVGGSNLAFGLNSEIVHQELGLNPVNLGLHVGIGLFPLLRAVEKHVRPEDVIVISPEYRAMFSSPRCSEAMAIELAGVWPGSKEYLQPDFDVPLDGLVPADSRLKQLASCVRTARKRLSRGDKLDTNREGQPSVYQRSSFNQFGDHVGHYQIASEKEPSFEGDLESLPEPGDETFAEIVKRLNQFNDVCLSVNAKVFMANSPVPQVYLERQPEWAEQVDQSLAEQIRIPKLTTVGMVAFQEGMFYDGSDHLTQLGAQWRTMTICDQLKRVRAAEASGNGFRWR